MGASGYLKILISWCLRLISGVANQASSLPAYVVFLPVSLFRFVFLSHLFPRLSQDKRAAQRDGKETVKHSRASDRDVSLRRRHGGATIILHPTSQWKSSQKDILAPESDVKYCCSWKNQRTPAVCDTRECAQQCFVVKSSMDESLITNTPELP